MNRIKSYRNYIWMFHVKPLFRPFKDAYNWLVRRICRKQRLLALRMISNLKPDEMRELSEDDAELLRTMSEYLLPSQWITRNGNIVYTCPLLETVTLWQMIEARMAETAMERIKGWTGGYVPETIADMVKLTKFIAGEMERADQFERVLLPAGGGTSERNPIAEAKSVLGMVQLASELMHCSFEEAKLINYSDVILAISARHEEVERQKSKTK
ncbi:hypothetical protein SJC23_3 [Bacteroides phage SJC23]|nr:hypothetical protein SJC01_3 [Bacteroides phage SJC01]QIG65130.1 hypothetical protein SJC13_3 [Bacteroides phage SJC13]QIG65227.1 hypothetical protein SJC15_3 [Bacteroides phage SJC15]QIG65517.1 hypothetical protein SJC23_3 [Bacteroides phage SJC23]